MSTEAHAKILALDLTRVRAAEGVAAVLTAADIPGANNVGPVVPDEPALAADVVQFRGQPLFAVAATSVELARRAARLARIEYERLDPVVTIEQALEASEFVLPSVRCERGSVAGAPGRGEPDPGPAALRQRRSTSTSRARSRSPSRASAARCWCTPRPSIRPRSSTSWRPPLGLPDAAVTVELRRMGGGFGGKETQAAVYAIGAALLARATRPPGEAPRRPRRRHGRHRQAPRLPVPTTTSASTDEGRIEALDLTLASRCGLSADLSGAVNDRAVFHCRQRLFPAERAHRLAPAARPTPCPTPRSAASAGRRACSRRRR